MSRYFYLRHRQDLFFFLSQAFMDICKYFSEEEWGKLGNSEKITHVYMKRNYDTMTRLGNRKFWVQTGLGTQDHPSFPLHTMALSQAAASVPFYPFLWGEIPEQLQNLLLCCILSRAQGWEWPWRCSDLGPPRFTPTGPCSNPPRLITLTVPAVPPAPTLLSGCL